MVFADPGKIRLCWLGPLKSVPQVSLWQISCPSVSLKISKCPSVSLNNPKCPSPRRTYWTSRCSSHVLWCPSKFQSVPQYSSKVQSVRHDEGPIGWPGVPYVSLGIPQKSQVSTRGTPWMDRCPQHPSGGFRVPRCPQNCQVSTALNSTVDCAVGLGLGLPWECDNWCTW